MKSRHKEPQVLTGDELAACDKAAAIGKKFDFEKPDWSLLPAIAVSSVVDVLTYGAKKYSPDGWRKIENPKERYFAAAMRHLWAWRKGEYDDSESGLPHLAHAACCVFFMLELDNE